MTMDINNLKRGIALRTCLAMRNISLKRLSRGINKTSHTIYKWLDGSTNITANDFDKLLNILQIDYQEFNEIMKWLEKNYIENFKI